MEKKKQRRILKISKNGKKKRKRNQRVKRNVEVDVICNKQRRRREGFTKNSLLIKPLLSLWVKIHVVELKYGCEVRVSYQYTKAIWDYIKEHVRMRVTNDCQNLQNPENKREIMCDAKLKTVLQADQINMFHIAKMFKEHLKELDHCYKHPHFTNS